MDLLLEHPTVIALVKERPEGCGVAVAVQDMASRLSVLAMQTDGDDVVQQLDSESTAVELAQHSSQLLGCCEQVLDAWADDLLLQSEMGPGAVQALYGPCCFTPPIHAAALPRRQVL